MQGVKNSGYDPPSMGSSAAFRALKPRTQCEASPPHCRQPILSSSSTGATDPQAAHGHRQHYLRTRSPAHLQPRYLRFSSCRGFRSRPQRTGTNSVTGAVRLERAGSSAWDDMSAQGSSESSAQGCAGAAKHMAGIVPTIPLHSCHPWRSDVRKPPSHEPQIFNSRIPRQLIYLRL